MHPIYRSKIVQLYNLNGKSSFDFWSMETHRISVLSIYEFISCVISKLKVLSNMQLKLYNLNGRVVYRFNLVVNTSE